MMEIFNIFSGFKTTQVDEAWGVCFVFWYCIWGLWFGLFLFPCLLCNLLERINEWLWEGLEKSA